MLSATTADRSDSIEPSKAKEIALGRTAWIFSRPISGRPGMGSERGMPPNCVPMVSMGSFKSAVATAASATTRLIRASIMMTGSMAIMPIYIGRMLKLPVW